MRGHEAVTRALIHRRYHGLVRRALLALCLVACGSPGATPVDAPPDVEVDAAELVAPDVDTPLDAPTDAPADAFVPLGDPLAALLALPGTCTGDGWCWLHPAPEGNSISSIF